MSKTLVQKVKEELKKQGLEFVLKNEFSDKFKGDVYEGDKLVIRNHTIQKCLQWKSVGDFAKMTRELVEMKRACGMYES